MEITNLGYIKKKLKRGVEEGVKGGNIIPKALFINRHHKRKHIRTGFSMFYVPYWKKVEIVGGWQFHGNWNLSDNVM